ncbi:AfsR/SARP family transcriptional regulator [Streptomyces sp. NBC_00344]|uniref:AfsR/SARP family transcriptional regulator n=1 Tax=Streptomyces sp. NBC_00344 TaxID=2975720 RepID=UPI003FA686DA
MHKRQFDHGEEESEESGPGSSFDSDEFNPKFLTLGPVRIADGADLVALQPSKPANLLAALLLHPNSTVSAEFLQRVVWGEGRPATAKSALHTCVQRLRQVFIKYGIAGNLIEAVPGGYRITADSGSLDLIAFRDLLRSADSERDPAVELSILRAALSLWQGPLLANIHSDILQREVVPRLTEERLRAMERVFDIELALGRCRQVLAELWPVARSHPAHEPFWAQLVQALHRTDRRAEALSEYRRVKQYLRTELGVDPGPALQRLEIAVLRGDDLSAPPGGRVLPAFALRGGDPSSARSSIPPVEGSADKSFPSGGAAQVLETLIGAGLIEEGPEGHYRMHDLLRIVARGAMELRTDAAWPDVSPKV